MKDRLDQIELIINQDRESERENYNIVPGPAQSVVIFVCFFSMAVMVMLASAGV